MKRPERPHPSVEAMARLAVALRDLSEQVVFIGGAIAPLLQTDPPFDAPRPTKDVDAVIASANYGTMNSVHERLGTLGFRQDPARTDHLHRWRSPEGDILDLVPAGEHPGASGQPWDRLAIDTSVEADLGGGRVIRHASAPMFLALKLSAYADRGAADPFGSHDLEDIIALLAARPGIAEEVRRAPVEAGEFIRGALSRLAARPDFEDLIAGCLNNTPDPAGTVARVRRSLEGIIHPAGQG